MKRLAIIFFAIIVLLSGCAQPSGSTTASYKQITQEEAKEMMAKDDGHIMSMTRGISPAQFSFQTRASRISNRKSCPI